MRGLIVVTVNLPPDENPGAIRRRRVAPDSGFGGPPSPPGETPTQPPADGLPVTQPPATPHQPAGDAGGVAGGIKTGEGFAHPSEEFPFWEEILKKVQDEFVSRSTAVRGGDSSRTGHQVREALMAPDAYNTLVSEIAIKQNPQWGIRPIQLDRLVELLRAYQFGYGPLEDYMQIPGLEELYFNRYDQGFYIVSGTKHRIDKLIFKNQDALMAFVHRVAIENGLEINASRPALDATLRDGSRLNATLEPIAVDGPDFVIRKHREIPFTIEEYLERGMLTRELIADLDLWVKAGYNLIVSGGTSTGKTSLLNCLGNYLIPRSARVLVVENRKELQIYTEDTKYFQTREDASREGSDRREITMEDILRYILRKRPDHIIVGEVRGREAYFALTAWGSGHDGSLSTVHANNATDTVSRLEMLARGAQSFDQEGIRMMLARSIDIIIHVKRDHDGARRRVTEVVQVLHADKYDHYDEQTSGRVAQLLESGEIRKHRDEVWMLTIYRENREGKLVKVNDILPIDGKPLPTA